MFIGYRKAKTWSQILNTVALQQLRNYSRMERIGASCNVTNKRLITVLRLLQQHPSWTVYPGALFCCLSLTPSSIWGQSPAEGQMVSFHPLGLARCLMCSSVAETSVLASSTEMPTPSLFFFLYS